MNRRELFNKSASGLAGSLLLVTPIPELSWSENNKCTSPCNPGRTWKEDALTRKLEAQIAPQLAKVKTANNLDALSATQWIALSVDHASWGDEHSRLGNLHMVDLYVQAHQPELRKKFGNKEVDRMLTNGAHVIWTENANGLLTIGVAKEHFRMSAEQCSILGLYILDAGLLAAIMAVTGNAPAAGVFGALGLTFGLARYAFC